MKFKQLTATLAGQKKPLLAVLIDPDKFNPALVKLANTVPVSCFLVGGSRLELGNIHKTVSAIKRLSSIPVVLFPGDETQLTARADGLFLPSLLSGRNAEYLIGKQVLMAPIIRRMHLPVLPMAYLLLDGKRVSSTQKVTHTSPLGVKQLGRIRHTVLAAQQLGFQLLYLEAGSGARNSVPPAVIKAVKNTSSLPLIVGGGVDSAAKAKKLVNAGANMVVVGNALEKNVYLLTEISACFK